MTGEVINLRQARKRKARSDAETQADANRVTFGISKADRTIAAAKRQLDETRFSEHRRDMPDPPEP